MDQSLINFLLACFSGVMGWFGKTLWTAVQELKQDIKAIEVNALKDYVQKDDYKADIREIKELLKQLFDMQRNNHG